MGWQSDMTSVLGFSIIVSATATAIAAAVAIPLGIFMGMREFKGKAVIVNLFNSFMGFPPVVMGVLIYLLLSKAGPLGFLGLLYTPTAIIIAQCFLCIPIIAGITISSITNHSKKIIETTLALGGSRTDVYENVFSENLVPILSGVMVGFGQNLSEVGASMIVGGNISFFTQTITTAIVTFTGQGRAMDALLLGTVLIVTAFFIMFALTILQLRARRS
ncbi:MAG: ABC transporter permease [Candidatus Lokiarchaeota archaeon]|nr:ABC transporter permease [Candidatus Lokiarchaeota archaeon]